MIQKDITILPYIFFPYWSFRKHRMIATQLQHQSLGLLYGTTIPVQWQPNFWQKWYFSDSNEIKHSHSIMQKLNSEYIRHGWTISLSEHSIKEGEQFTMPPGHGILSVCLELSQVVYCRQVRVKNCKKEVLGWGGGSDIQMQCTIWLPL